MTLSHTHSLSITSSALKNGWQIISPKKSFAVFAATPTEKAEWMAHINKCIADLLAKSRSLTHLLIKQLSHPPTHSTRPLTHFSILGNKKPATEHAAVWVPDSDAQTCMHCLRTKFTPINRRVSMCVRCVSKMWCVIAMFWSPCSITAGSVELLCAARVPTGSSSYLINQLNHRECAYRVMKHSQQLMETENREYIARSSLSVWFLFPCFTG